MDAKKRFAWERVWWLCLLVVLGMPSCGGTIRSSGQSAFGVMPGVLNDPGNRTLRRSIMRYGLGQLCRELTHVGVPLQLRSDEPVAGRFYARSCNYQELDSGDLFVQFAGVGYLWTNLTWRLGFEASGAVHYNQDFLMDGSTMYAYFRTRAVVAKSFQAKMVEQGGLVASTIASVADKVAQDVVHVLLERGFTVIRDSQGGVDFSLGVISKGQRPAKPFEVNDADRVTLMNERTNVAGNQLDFLGPFTVTDNRHALRVTLVVDGAPGVDVALIDKNIGDRWLETFVTQPGIPKPHVDPIAIDMAPTRMKWTKSVPVPIGSYYIVLDNSNVIGNLAPQGTGGPVPSTAMVSVVVQSGEADD